VLSSELFLIVLSYPELFSVVLSSDLFSVLYVGKGMILATGIQLLIIRAEF